MADLGAIARLADPGLFVIRLFTPYGHFRSDTATISGTVLDDNGNPAARAVVAVRRADGVHIAATVSDAATGAYTLKVAPGEEYSVLFLDDAGGTLLNDLVQRVIPT